MPTHRPDPGPPEARLAAEVAGVDHALPGSLVHRWMRCGKANCRCKAIRTHLAAGRIMQRVHIVTEPLDHPCRPTRTAVPRPIQIEQLRDQLRRPTPRSPRPPQPS